MRLGKNQGQDLIGLREVIIPAGTEQSVKKSARKINKAQVKD